MATTVTPTTLKARATVMASLADAVVQAAIDEAVRWLSEEAWGSVYDDGVFYLACHIIAELEAQNAASSPAASASAVGAGPVTSESIQSWSVSYGGGGLIDEPFATTSWGRQFVARRRLVFASRCL